MPCNEAGAGGTGVPCNEAGSGAQQHQLDGCRPTGTAQMTQWDLGSAREELLVMGADGKLASLEWVANHYK